jgi:hypothetical protein
MALISYPDDIKEFLEERMAFIEENVYPISLAVDPPSRLICHLIPKKFHETVIDISELDKPENYFIESYFTERSTVGHIQTACTSEYNFDGIVYLSAIHEKHAYTQVFHNAIVEHVVAAAEPIGSTLLSYLPLLRIYKNLVKTLTKNLTLLQKFEIPGPFYIYLQMIAMENIRLDPDDIKIMGFDSRGRNKPLTRSTLDFPLYGMDYGSEVQKVLLPFFNALWNTFGFKGVTSTDSIKF